MDLGYLLTRTFEQLAGKYGVGIALATAVAIMCVKTIGHYLRARIDMMKADQKTADDERKAEREAKSAAHGLLVQELSTTRADLKLLLTNHLEHDRQDREKLTEILNDIHKDLLRRRDV